MSKRWHILREGEAWTLTRALPARFDLSAELWVPRVHPVRLMHQVRQDMWRALQRLRGYSPVVQLCPYNGGWQMRAGGAALPPVSDVWQDRIIQVLGNSDHQARWLRHAGSWSAPSCV
jgi:hypothetical protein